MDKKSGEFSHLPHPPPSVSKENLIDHYLKIGHFRLQSAAKIKLRHIKRFF